MHDLATWHKKKSLAALLFSDCDFDDLCFIIPVRLIMMSVAVVPFGIAFAVVARV